MAESHKRNQNHQSIQQSQIEKIKEEDETSEKTEV